MAYLKCVTSRCQSANRVHTIRAQQEHLDCYASSFPHASAKNNISCGAGTVAAQPVADSQPRPLYTCLNTTGKSKNWVFAVPVVHSVEHTSTSSMSAAATAVATDLTTAT